MQRQTRYVDSGKVEAEFHGGGPKVGMIKFSLMKIYEGMERSDWRKCYSNLNILFIEFYPYFNKDDKKLIGKWKELTALIEKQSKGTNIANMYGLITEFTIDLKKIEARLGLDMELKQERKHLTGGMA